MKLTSPYTFINRAVRFPGIGPSRGTTKVIKQIFCPHFHASRMRNRPKNIGGLNYKQARNRGKAVDRGLSRWVCGQTPVSSLTEVKELIKWFQLNHPSWKPVQTQYVVACPIERLATQVDILMYCTILKRFIIVEVKTGCLARRCTTLPPNTIVGSADVSHTLLHQHQLQTLISKHLFEHTHPEHIGAKMLLIYVTEKGMIEAIDQSQFFAQSLPDNLIEMLVQTRDCRTTKKRRKRKQY